MSVSREPDIFVSAGHLGVLRRTWRLVLVATAVQYRTALADRWS
jgi:hypothetical protein